MNPVLYYIGRLCQLVGLAMSGWASLLLFDQSQPIKPFFRICMIGAVIFFIGHFILLRRE